MQEAGIPYEPTGALLVAWTEEQKNELPAIREKAAKNGVRNLGTLSAARVYELEPHLGPGALGGLLIPGEFIVCPYTPPLAFATEAVLNGATLLLNSALTEVTRGASRYELACGEHRVRARWVVNAAGLASDTVDALFGHRRFVITPRRGQLIVFDKLARPLLSHVLLPVPTKTTKGVLVSPTVFGNVLLGPTAENLKSKTDTDTTRVGLASLFEKGRAILPALLREEVTATYAGLRAASNETDYQIHVDAKDRYVCVGGIRSTGLSAALGIAEYVAGAVGEAGLALVPRARFERVVMPPIGQAQGRPFESASAIAANADYGRIVCHCERVTRGELLDATRSPIPATNLDGLRLPHALQLQGRCPGLFRLPRERRVRARRSARHPGREGPRRGAGAGRRRRRVRLAFDELERAWDVIIVGAGPAGLSAAAELRKARGASTCACSTAKPSPARKAFRVTASTPASAGSISAASTAAPRTPAPAPDSRSTAAPRSRLETTAIEVAAGPTTLAVTSPRGLAAGMPARGRAARDWAAASAPAPRASSPAACRSACSRPARSTSSSRRASAAGRAPYGSSAPNTSALLGRPHPARRTAPRVLAMVTRASPPPDPPARRRGAPASEKIHDPHAHASPTGCRRAPNRSSSENLDQRTLETIRRDVVVFTGDFGSPITSSPAKDVEIESRHARPPRPDASL